jgi:RNA polymerase sigma factor (sigma-70 family)
MKKGQSVSVLGQLHTLFTSGTPAGLSDGELLERYAARRAEAADASAEAELAFAALVDRHGAMVWGVCRRVLGDTHEAEDAFQATFLVLVRRAGSVRVDGSLGRWLYGVAHRVALRARQEAGRRGSEIDRVPIPSSDDPAGDAEIRELRRTVGEELDRLPAKYRCPVELCHLQGMTYDQAARQLDWPVATVKSRLSRARLRLRKRLMQRGLAPGAVAAAMSATLAAEARAAVPPQLVRCTVRAAASCAFGAFPATVVALSRGVLKMMMWEKLGLVAAGTLAVAVGLTAQAVSQQAPNGGKHAPRPIQAVSHAAEKPAEEAPADPRWTRSLPSGATIEVVGVSTFPSGPNTWWRPDGTPLFPPPCDSFEAFISGENMVRKSVVVRLSQIPDRADCLWSIPESGGGAQGQASREGKPVPGLRAKATLFPADAETCTVRFQVAAGPWKTIHAWTGHSEAVGGIEASYVFGEAIATQKGTTISVTHNIQGKAVRLVAVDADGKESTAVRLRSPGVKDFTQIVAEFDKSPEWIKEFRLQSRPYDQVEIPGVVLRRKP